MNNSKLNFESTILIPYDASGDFDSVRQSIHDGIIQVEGELRAKHPDAEESEVLHTLWHMIISNWAITAIAANEV